MYHIYMHTYIQPSIHLYTHSIHSKTFADNKNFDLLETKTVNQNPV